MARVKKRYFVLGIFALLIVSILFFASTFTKDYLVKNSEKLIGRKLTIGEMHFNYAKVAVQVKDLVLFEANKTDSFASFSEFYINLNPWTLLSREYSVSEIRLTNPRIQVIQDGEKFNFDSLMPKEDSIAVKDTTQKESIKFTIRNIQLIDGKVKYNDLQKKNQVEMDNLNLDLPLISWNNEKSNMGIDFMMGKNGKVNIQATVDNVNKKYQIDLSTQDIQIQPITGYLTDYFDVKSLNGLLTSNLKIVGDMNEVINISITGKGSVTALSVIDGQSEEIISSSRLTASLKDINLKTFHFGFGKIEANEPHILVVREKKMMNLERFLLPYFRNDSISSSATITTTAESTPVTYSIDTIKVSNGLVSISDKTLNRPFSYELNDLSMTMSGLTESADRIPVEFSTKLNNRGELSGKTVWSMVDMMKLEMDAKIKRMDLMSFSPYTEYYVASPVKQGWFNYELGLKMSSTNLVNTNKVKVDELEFGKKTKDTTAMKVPVRLGLYLMKDANDEIKIDLPVSGNPSEPKFKLGRLIWKTFANLMVKTALSPFKALGGLAGTNPESLDKLSYTFAQDSLDKAQRDELSQLAGILKKKPNLILTLTQTADPEKEKSEIAVQLTKSEYLATQATDAATPKLKAGEIKNDDANLLAFIRKTIPAVDSLGIEKACEKIVDAGRIESRFQSLLTERNRLVNDFLTVNQGIPTESIQVTTADLKNLAQELKVPQFKIEVSIK
ncbi:exported protein [Aquipluma nitroreducens]|uniref:Exported protein n=1 Tax=Aquipluma nitroreducens TaxID=2010828 RepID=A0A5K7SFU9_9BACT|nr:DUF748 domain-containing protein [Aquipluma nitroreducens]BBE20512.1 exported protein [Aquipluma nitroreducens]